MDRKDIADQVGLEIYTTEEALDDAFVRVTGLVNALVKARRDAHLSTTVGHEVFESLNEVCGAITSARGSLVQAHKRLDVVRRSLRLAPVASAPIDKSDDIAPETVRALAERRAA